MTTLAPGPAAELREAMLAAQELLPRPDQAAQAGSSPATPTSSPPWNQAAADALLDAHEGIRRLEASLRAQVTGRPGARRGGSDAATLGCLRAITALANGVSVRDQRRAAKFLDRWARAVGRLRGVDEIDRWTEIRIRDWCGRCDKRTRTVKRAPRCPDRFKRPAAGGRCPACGLFVCPYCQTPSLRACTRAGTVACFRPGCEDSDGDWPFGRLDYSRLNGDAIIAWSDGLVMGA